MSDTRSSAKILPLLYKITFFALPVFLLLILFLHAKKYLPFISDDALISLRYSKRLLEGHGLTWTEGIRVEGYSNLLWVVLVAVLGLFNIELVLASRILGFMCMATVVIVYLVHYYRAHNLSLSGLITVGIGGLFFVLSAPIAVWAIGGLEQALVAAILAPMLVLNIRMLTADEYDTKILLWLSLCLGLLSITRIDGLIYTFMTLLAMVLVKGIKKDTIVKGIMICSFPVGFTGIQMIFRRLYYNAWVPNTALVKVSPSLKHFKDGFTYLTDGLLSLGPFSFIVVFVLLLMLFYNKTTRKKGLLLLVVTGVWSAYLIFIGGDIFPSFRHFIPLVTPMALILIEGIDLVLQKFSKLPEKIIVYVFITGMFVMFFTHQSDHKENIRATTERWEWEGQAIGMFLKDAFAEKQPLFAVTAAGCLPYWSELPCLDMLGLNDYFLPRNLPPDFGQGMIGHELGNGQYVYDSKPDLICFCRPAGRREPCFRSGVELYAMEAFHQEYTLVKFRADKPMVFTSELWVRLWSPKIGIVADDTVITIPGYLFNANPKTVCYLSSQGKPVVSLTNTQPLEITDVTIADEIKDIQVVPDTPGLEIKTEKLPSGAYKITIATGSTTGAEVEEVRILR